MSGYRDGRVRPSPSPSPPLPDSNVLGAEQWGMLAAIADAVVPSFTPSKGNRLLQHPLQSDVYEAAARRIAQLSGAANHQDLISEYLSEGVTAQPEFRQCVYRLVGFFMDSTARNGLMFVLNTLK
jgi:hypothetical protein